ncbi:MAG TPA: pyruvate kinase alpha/beta domain-containing protein [Deltaproteobacteria bacterium]|nr:pyruvate kinase alpha/beta domain-containing protein [Deltaproteobacteria bacterium]HOI06504.1 pyruvate kinase alpha/beta domain-containing protein [Deltaproteobacteria bacterium]
MKLVQTMLFDRPGDENTDHCIRLAAEQVKAGGVKYVVVASTTGKTAQRFLKGLEGSGAGLVIVTHSVGFKEPGHDEFDRVVRKQLAEAGVPVHTGTILTHSLEKSIMDSFNGAYPGYIIASTLRRFGEGTKVAVEIVMEACDAGLVPEDAEVLSVAGTGRGSDTVLIVKAKPSKRFLELEVLEILARPRGR